MRELQSQGNPGIVMALAGNKADLGDARAVEAGEATEYATANGLVFLETSAKDATNVTELFQQIARKLPKLPPPAPPAGNVSLQAAKPKAKSACSGC